MGSRPARRQSFAKGLLVGLGNPKMVLFFVAFFPQFIDPERGSAVTQMLVLGAILLDDRDDLGRWLCAGLWRDRNLSPTSTAHPGPPRSCRRDVVFRSCGVDCRVGQSLTALVRIP
jgi:LysE type translocator